MNYRNHEGAETPFRTFEDREVYQKAREFRKSMYEVTRRLPDIEKYALASQMRRAAVSLTNNLAEAHGRHHYLDQLQFVLHARGSLEELMDDMNVCLDERYLPLAEVETLKQSGRRVHQLINGYGRYLRNRRSNPGVLHERPAAKGSADEDCPF